MAVPRSCEECWAKGSQWVQAAFIAPDDRALCRPCVVAEGFEFSACTPIAPKAMAAAAAAGPVVTVHAAKPAEFAASKEGQALISAAVKHVQEEKTMERTTKCGRDGCEVMLTERNSSGYCAKHFYDSKKKNGKSVAGGGEVKSKLQRKTAKRAAKASNNGKGLLPVAPATLMFTEAQLVTMFSGLPLEMKVECLQSYLDRTQA